MADPRLDVRFEGIGYQAETYKIDNSTITYSATEDNGSAQVGLAVTLSAAETVATAADAEGIRGKLIEVRADNYCTVQTKGFCTLPAGTSATLTLGAAIVGDLLVAAEGYVRVSDGSTAAEIIVQKGAIIDAGTTTAVVVDLG